MTKRRSPRKPSKPDRPGRRAQPIFWTDRALSDLDAIGEYIARDDPAAAARWVMRLVSAAEQAAKAPLTGRRVPEIARDDVREVFVRTYRIVYRARGDRCEILTVFEGHRAFPRRIAPRPVARR